MPTYWLHEIPDKSSNKPPCLLPTDFISSLTVGVDKYSFIHPKCEVNHCTKSASWVSDAFLEATWEGSVMKLASTQERCTQKEPRLSNSRNSLQCVWNHHSLHFIIWSRNTLKSLQSLQCSCSPLCLVWNHSASNTTTQEYHIKSRVVQHENDCNCDHT